MEESGVAQIGSMATIFLDVWRPRLEFALLWLGSFNAALILVAMVVVVWLLFFGSLHVHSDRKASTFRHFPSTFRHFLSLSITFCHFASLSVTFHGTDSVHFPSFPSFPSLSVTFRHFPSLSVTVRNCSVTFRHFTFFLVLYKMWRTVPPLSVTFRHFPSLSVTFRHFPSLSVTLLNCFSFCPSLSVTFRHFLSLSINRSSPLKRSICPHQFSFFSGWAVSQPGPAGLCHILVYITI